MIDFDDVSIQYHTIIVMFIGRRFPNLCMFLDAIHVMFLDCLSNTPSTLPSTHTRSLVFTYSTAVVLWWWAHN